jgi:sulfur-oxidizing protein SoxA
MRFPDALAACAALWVLALPDANAAADAARAEVAARLRDAPAFVQGDDVPPEAATLVEAGRKLFTAKFADGKTLASCFPNGGRRIAASYPQYDARLKRVVTLEMAINQCRKAHGEALYEATDAETMGAALAYLRSLSDGQKIAVRVPAAAEERFEQGRRIYFTRMGQRNYACASCHVQGAGRYFGDEALSPAIGQATHWPVVRDGKPVMLQMRIRECLERMGAAPFAVGSDELNHIEYFLAYLSNGLVLKANVKR